MTKGSSRSTTATGATLKTRRAEVVARLAAFGLSRGPRRLSRGASSREREEGRGRRLCAALESLGPVFSSYGLYLATRVDLLPEQDRRELAAIDDRAAALPPSAVADLIERELGHPPLDLFHAFEEVPFASWLLSQTHRAWLPGGRPVTVKLLRPAVRDCAARDVELLPLLKVALAGRVGSDQALDDAAGDFRAALERKADLLAEARALETLARDAGDSAASVRVAEPHRALCTRGLLTLERPPGPSLGDLLSPSRGAEGAGEIDRSQLARRLCAAWLKQAILRGLFPVEFSASDVSVLPGGHLVLAGGDFDTLRAESRTNLWGYLVAAAREDPRLACSHLIKELSGGEAADSEELWRRFRQAAPFHVGAWGDGDGLAERLATHWRLAGEFGYVSRGAVPSFYRGLLTVAGLARRLAPDRDALAEAVQDVRLVAGMERLRSMIGPDQLGEQFGRYATLVMDFPQRLDEVLTLGAEGDARVRLKMPESEGRRGRGNSSTRAVVLLLVLAAFVLWAQHPIVRLGGAWADAFKAFGFVALGALALRAASRA
jgi:predicted unusual protein kinase regulating ubiquinone biosynthesis (AarF/ABC1/UbiB family)